MSSAIFAQSGSIKGQVLDEGSNEPIPLANIIITDTQVGCTSDFEGNFILKEVPPGFHRLRASVLGYKGSITETIEVVPNKTLNIEIYLTKQTYKLDEVVIKASPFKRKEESPVSMRSLGISEIDKTPGGNRDISKVIQALPGVSSSVGSSFRNDLIVRGGGPSENVFFIDGIEIPNLNHFATQGASGGPVGIINADFVSALDFYSGAFPAFAGEALSSVLDFKMVSGNETSFKYKGSVGASDLSLTADGPLSKRTTAIFSVRRSYLKFLFNLLGLPFLPTYNDYQCKIKTKINKKNEFTFLSLGALDHFKLNTKLDDPSEVQRFILNSIPTNNQWSYMIGGIYKHFRKRGYSKLVVSRNMLSNNLIKYKDNDESDEENRQIDIQSWEIENKIRLEHLTRVSGFKINYGVGYEHSLYRYRMYQKIIVNDRVMKKNTEHQMRLNSWGLFGQVSKGFFNERAVLSVGLRADANDYSKTMINLFHQLSPRLSFSYALSEQWFLNMNMGRYYKRPEYTTLGYKSRNGRLVNKDNEIKYIASNHYVAGIEWQPLENAKITGEFFYKTYHHYPFSVADRISLSNKGGDFGIVGAEEVLSIGEGRSYGFELFTRLPSYKTFNMVLSYTFVRSEFKDEEEKFIPALWDNRHIVNFTLMKAFKHNWDAGIKWRYVGGTPYTPYDMEKSQLIRYWDIRNQPYLDYSRFNTLRLSPFHQLDVRIDKTFYFEKWELGFYIDVQNVYNFKGETPDYLTNLDENGVVLIDPNNPEQYQLRRLKSSTGTILPSIGIKVAF